MTTSTFSAAVQAFLTALPAASLHAVRTGIRTFGPDNQTVLIAESLLDSHTLCGAANTETVYTLAWLDTTDGPLVLEVPPRMLGLINDFWGRYVTDVGNAGPDKGQGGKYLLLPPGYTGAVPDGYFVARSRTYGNFVVFRGFLVDGDPRPAVENIKQHFRVYPLAAAANPPAMTFVNISGAASTSSPPTTRRSSTQSTRSSRKSRWRPPTRRRAACSPPSASRKGKPFAPDARMQRILAEAAAVGNATARAIVFRHARPRRLLLPG